MADLSFPPMIYQLGVAESRAKVDCIQSLNQYKGEADKYMPSARQHICGIITEGQLIKEIIQKYQ